MKRITTLATFVIAIIVFSLSASGQQNFSEVVTDADRWSPIEHTSPEACAGSAEECAVKMLTELDISVGDKPGLSVYQLGKIDEKNVTVVFVSHLPEDSELVLGNLYRLELNESNGEDGAFTLAGLGQMFQCMNGPVGWRKTACE